MKQISKQIISIFLVVLTLFMLVGCQTEPVTKPTKEIPVNDEVRLSEGTYSDIKFDPSADIKEKEFQSVEEYQNFIKDNQGSSYYGRGGWGGAVKALAVNSMSVDMMETAPMAMDDGATTSAQDLDFSETNNQVKGVDEADIIKTDGNYIYTLSKNNLIIMKAYPAVDAEVLASIDLEDMHPESVFIEENKLAVFGSIYNNDVFKEIDFTPRQGMSFITIYDTTDKTNPQVVKEYKFEGSYYNGRMYDGKIYILTKTQPIYRTKYPLPVYIEDSKINEITLDRISYYPLPYDNPQLVTVHKLDFKTNQLKDSLAVTVDWGQNVYMSKENLYITSEESINEWDLEKEVLVELLEPYLTDFDRELIKKIKKTDNDVLSKQEKENKIYEIYMSYGETIPSDEQEELEEKADELLEKKLKEIEFFHYTIINKIDLEDLRVVANSKVPGNIINQFSMDEFEGNFRIATTVPSRWSRIKDERRDSFNNVFILDEGLEQVGELTNLAEDESIYSARFMGERLYMVTFKQIDPFFVIDLSNPKNPSVLGELKIPGFSRYLHPYDKNTVIGIGQDATESGRTKGLKISLFNVEDVENPEEIAKFVTDEKYASSTALWEHKAFLFNRERNLMVIPAYSQSYHWEDKYDDTESYNGAFVFKITSDEIALRGLVDHSKYAEHSWAAAVERSLFIEDMLYTKSTNMIRINSLDDLHSVKNVTLSKASGKIAVY